MFLKAIVSITIFFVSLSLYSASAESIDKKFISQLPEGSSVAHVKKKEIDGRKITVVKYLDAEGRINSMLFDENNREVVKRSSAKSKRRVIGKSLERAMNKKSSAKNEKIKVVVALKNEIYGTEKIPKTVLEADLAEYRDKKVVTLNNRKVSESEIESRQAARAKRIGRERAKRFERNREKLRKFIERTGRRDRNISEAFEKGKESVTLEVSREEIEELVKRQGDLISGVELFLEKKPEIADAMIATNIDPWALNYDNRQGNGIGIFVSETPDGGGCPSPVLDYWTVLLNGSYVTAPVLRYKYHTYTNQVGYHGRDVVDIVRSVSPESYIYCDSNENVPSADQLDGYGGNPAVYVENHAYGIDSTAAYTITDKEFDNHVYNNFTAVFKSAGNNADVDFCECYHTGDYDCNDADDVCDYKIDDLHVTTPGKAFNVITVGAYNDETNEMADFSSFRNPETGNEKPEISAPGENISIGGNGTSLAAPHAAAFAADLIGSYTWMKHRPHIIKAAMLASARDQISGHYAFSQIVEDWDNARNPTKGQVGVGGIDFRDVYFDGRIMVWEGENGSFPQIDTLDGLQFTFNVSTTDYSNIRIALSWLNRGDYIYDHRQELHPIGMDLDVAVYNPNGEYMGGGFSFDSPFEYFDFKPTMTGDYKVSIIRYGNYDRASKLYVGLWVNYDM